MVLSVKDIAKIKTKTTIKFLFSLKIKSKKAKSGTTSLLREKEIKPVYPIQKTRQKIINEE